ncbi:hypothetical protein [Streptomyces anandii]|uniref:hypothetical protein n=1 Tax=Streptomyces anandii TaxID=285454 RepID=UPI001675F2D8|nr:hypothetical protein [Streptomyces anandii]GGX68301.1 hypothetical protein GCM10010510_11030 [Streptomyces anandii JCM 4720]
MEFGDFAVRFRPVIRAALDWGRLADVGAGVRVETVTGGAARRCLAGLFTVWYADARGADSSWNSPGSRPLRVGSAGRTLPSWPEDRRRAVDALARGYAEGSRPVPLTLPTYRVGEDCHVLLDGNHRAVAAHRAGRDVELTLWALTGPVCEGILPDLHHYAAPLG